MTVRVRREVVVDAPPETVWAFIADPAKRAGAISVVDEFEVHDDGSATWHVRLPIPMVRSTIAVETEETERDPPRHVKFVGRSAAFRVTGEHRVESTPDGGTRLANEFVVEGKLPGVERFFERNFERELENLESALRAEVTDA
ncbi:CoxG family protein [Halorarum salinum]|uniref:SRPBCC family protein n=1 Tax=Halorarum salinum TaxID=2743089 RepID=A0A7D5LAX8_9EURY|nr:SRPBCC family protein [Halobaculum salinum]QLG61689.1 SRPBCC family protein [Halobaculum salinum]